MSAAAKAAPAEGEIARRRIGALIFDRRGDGVAVVVPAADPVAGGAAGGGGDGGQPVSARAQKPSMCINGAGGVGQIEVLDEGRHAGGEASLPGGSPAGGPFAAFFLARRGCSPRRGVLPFRSEARRRRRARCSRAGGVHQVPPMPAAVAGAAAARTGEDCWSLMRKPRPGWRQWGSKRTIRDGVEVGEDQPASFTSASSPASTLTGTLRAFSAVSGRQPDPAVERTRPWGRIPSACRPSGRFEGRPGGRAGGMGEGAGGGSTPRPQRACSGFKLVSSWRPARGRRRSDEMNGCKLRA